MKQDFVRVWAVVIGIVLTLAVGNAFAQQAQEGQQKQAVKTIFDYKAELNLTDDQVKKIKEYITTLDKDVKVFRAKLTILDADVQSLMKKDGDLNEIKKKIREAFDIQASIKIADLEASRKINETLKPEQLNKWREIQAAAASKSSKK